MKYNKKQQIAIAILVMIPTIALLFCAQDVKATAFFGTVEVTNLNISLQETDNLVIYQLSVSGKPGVLDVITQCNFIGETLMDHPSAIIINDKPYPFTITKDLAAYVCGQRGA